MKKFLIPMLVGALMPVMSVRADDNPMAEQMEVIDDAYKGLRRVEDPAEGAKLAREGQAAVVKAMMMTPEFVEAGGHPDGKEKALLSYKRQMAALFLVFCDAEAACLDGDLEKIQELVQSFKDSKKQGHNEFMDDE